MRLGTNVTHIEPARALELGCQHLEVSLLWEADLVRAEANTISMIEKIEAMPCDYSIHLPIFSREYPYHVFSAYFLDDDKAKREASFLMVEENLTKLQHFHPVFYVIHFSGVYPQRDPHCEGQLLSEALDRLDQMAARYNTRILLEYFGFNHALVIPESWDLVNSYKNLGVLVDTGHLLFSARMHGLNFEQLFLGFIKTCAAIHIWNTGTDLGFYEESESYIKYHHMVPRFFQNSALGYGIDMSWIRAQLSKSEIPLIIEASVLHRDSGTLEEAILEWANWLR